MNEFSSIMNSLTFNKDGLIPVIVQQYDSGEILMLAWMNREALSKTISSKQMCYWSRSRKKLWHKGEISGQVQYVKKLSLDCDGDTILAKIDQNGVACHTGRRSCFFRTFENGKLKINQDVLINLENFYEK